MAPLSARIAVVGGTGKTGRAVTSALRGAVPSGPAGPLGLDRPGRRAHRMRRGLRHRAGHARRRGGVHRGGRDRRTAGRPDPPGAALGRVALRPGDAAPRRQGPGRGRRTPLRHRPGAMLQPGVYVQNFAPDTTVRLPYRAEASFGFADLDDVAPVAARVLLEEGHEGATYELASFRATVAELAPALGRPSRWSDPGSGRRPRARAWSHGSATGSSRCSPTTTATGCRWGCRCGSCSTAHLVPLWGPDLRRSLEEDARVRGRRSR